MKLTSSKKAFLKIQSINIQVNVEIILYEIVKGEGSLIVMELIKALRNK
jgi:hypothetical protein